MRRLLGFATVLAAVALMTGIGDSATAGTCPADLGHYFRLDESTGPPYVDDIVSNNATCTNCPSPGSGIVGSGQAFDGLEDEVDIPDDDTFDWTATSSFTIEFWMRTAASTAGNRVMVGRDPPSGSNLHWWIGADNNGTVRFQCRDTGGGGPYLGGIGPVLNDDVWHHIVCVRDEATDSNKVYVDAVLIDAAVYNYANGFDSDVPVNVGYLNLSGHYRYEGLLDELAVYDRALTQSEISAHRDDGLLGIGICGSSDPTPLITSTPVTTATVGQLYSYDVNAVGDPTPEYTLTVYPAGMTINATTGLIEWTPGLSDVGPNEVWVLAWNTAGADTQSYWIDVSAPPSVTGVSLSSGSGMFLTSDDLTAGYTLTGTATTAATAWYVSASPPAPLMAFYLPMEGGAAHALEDQSGHGITAVPHGDPTWSATAGHDGHGAWVFDGSGDDLSGGENFPLDSSYTKTAWVYSTGDGANGGNNIISGDANGGGHAFWAPTTFGRHLSAGHNGTWNIVQDPVALALNTWYFVAVTWDASTGDMALYKNGAIVDSGNTGVAVTDATISVGSFGSSNGYMWAGTIDEVRIYPRALSSAQIQSLYASGPDVIVSDETAVGEMWMAMVTPFSESEAGTPIPSDTVLIAGPPETPVITSTPVTTGDIGVLYTYDVDATGNPAPAYSLDVSPAGMDIDAASGVITWVPASDGIFDVTVRASNSAGNDTQSYQITVAPQPGVGNLTLFSAPAGDFRSTDDLAVGFDLVAPAITAATAWYASASPPVPIMALYLPMEGGATNALKDYSGNGIVATTHGDPIWSATAGHDGYGAWVFDGSGDDLSAGENFPVGASYTKTAWVYRTGSGANGGNNIISGDANGGGHAFWAPDMFGNKLSGGHNQNWDIVQDDVVLALNTWFFVALSYDAVTHEMILYKDGVGIDTATVDPADQTVTDATISIGSFGASNGWMWVGTIDDARVWNRVLSADQIAALYSQDATVIDAAETAIGEQWAAYVTPFSADAAGGTLATDTVTITETPVAALVTGYNSRWATDHVEIAWTLIELPDAFEFEVWRTRAGAPDGRLLTGVIEREGGRFVLRDRDVERGAQYLYRVAVLEDGHVAASFATSVTTPALQFALDQNWPNPFNPVTRIGFSTAGDGPVSLRIYDIAGRLVRTLVNDFRPAGTYREIWDGHDDSGARVASGIYFYRLDSGQRSITRKAMLLR
jgi:hypothetical protein